MYEKHPHLKEPNEDTKLWRYMDLSKFLALLETESLHMAVLSSFEDPFEGCPPKKLIDKFTAKPASLNKIEYQNQKKVVENNIETLKNSRNFISASCWHINQSESAGMWSQYLKAGEGIAIQTSFSKLKQAISDNNHSVHGAVVQYIDFDKFELDEINVLAWAALKRKSFGHENEFRLLSLDGPIKKGFQLKVNPQLLIDNIYIAPTTPDWVHDLIRAIIGRYEYSFVPVRSELTDGPSYYSSPDWIKDD